MPAQIRFPVGDDSERMEDLHRALDSESTFMLASPGERARYADLTSNTFRLVAEQDGMLVGYIDVRCLPWSRARGRGHIIMGVRASHSRQGIGRRLLQTAIGHARELGMWRLEMTTMTHNAPALGLYLSCGFRVEGLRRCSLLIDDRAVDEYYLGLLLQRSP